MARMIPSLIDEETKSNAERFIYDLFKHDEITYQWTVIHSLANVHHIKLPIGESDFIVIAPHVGIFVLEVKGGRVSRGENGMWCFTDKNGSAHFKKRSPFVQASDGMFSLMSYLRENDVDINRITFGFGAMFPDISFTETSPEWDRRQIFDIRNGSQVGTYVKNLAKFTNERINEFGRGRKTGLDLADAAKITNLLRGEFDFSVSLSTEADRSEKNIVSLTSMQFALLDAIENNPRMLFSGPAGTGKTLLAVEAIRRFELNNVALICYNTNLSIWLRLQISRLGLANRVSFVGTFHSMMVQNVKNAGISYSRDNLSNDSFLSEDLPILFFESLDTCPKKFDALIVDEAQDLFKDPYLEVFDSILEGGLQRGRAYFFGDFENQTIFDRDMSQNKAAELLMARNAFFGTYSLCKNCRNTEEICDYLYEETGVTYKGGTLAGKSGIKVRNRFYKDINDEAEKLEKELEALECDFRGEEIVLLSMKKREFSCVSLMKRKVPDYCIANRLGITFATVQSFKGLESKVVVLLDVDDFGTRAKPSALLYVALSRPRSLLIVFSKDGALFKRFERNLKGVNYEH